MKRKTSLFSSVVALLLAILLAFTGCDTTKPPSTNPPHDNGGKPKPNCEHADSDDNGLCDICEISVMVTIDFYAINDLHGKFKDTESNEGVDELTTYLRDREKYDDHVVLLSSGDMWQGSSESNLTKGMIITEWMNELDFASMTLGNHEYDWGEEFIEANDAIAEFPFLAINVYDSVTNKRVEYCDASAVIECDGIQIGIIGAIGDCYSSISGDKSDGFYIKTGNELTSLVKAESARLRAEGVDYIVYSVHDGYDSSTSSNKYVSSGDISSYYNTSLSNGYVDLVFEGHTHQKYVLIDNYGIYHLQNGGENKNISHAEIRINSITGSSRVSAAGTVPAATYTKFDDDPIVNTLLEKYKEQISIADDVLGNNAYYRDSNTIKQKVAELYYEYGVKKWGAEYDIVLGGGFITTRSPYNLYTGSVKYSDVYSILPFDNNLVLCSIKGSDLRSRFFETDNKNYYIHYGSYGEEVKNNIEDNKIYYIIVDSYSSTYSWNRLTEIERETEPVFARDLLADYIKKGGFN